MWYVKSKPKQLAAVGVGLALLFAPALAWAASGTIQSQICTPFAETHITAPADNTQTNESAAHITGTAEPGIVVSILRNGTGAGAATTAADGTFGLEIPLLGGNNSIIARGTNDCGTNHDSAAISVFRIVPQETTPTEEPAPQSPEVVGLPPTIPDVTPGSTGQEQPADEGLLGTPTVTKPKNGSTTDNQRAWVQGTADPGSVVSIILNGKIVAQAVTSQDGTFAALVSLQEGANNIQVIATLGGQSATSKNITLTYTPKSTPLPQTEPKDTTLPAIVIAAGGIVLTGISLYGGIATSRWIKRRLLPGSKK